MKITLKYKNEVSLSMPTQIGFILDFSAEHPCWSGITSMFDNKQCTIDLLSSYYNFDSRLLTTSIRINGTNSAVKQIRKGISQSQNVQRMHSFFQPTSENRNKSAFCNFDVKAEDTITQAIVPYSPVHFSVEIEHGVEKWSVIFLNKNHKLRYDVIDKIEHTFAIDKISTYDITYDIFMKGNMTKNYDSLDLSILKSLVYEGYYDEYRSTNFREVAQSLGISPATVSRRIKRLEKEALSDLMRKQLFS